MSRKDILAYAKSKVGQSEDPTQGNNNDFKDEEFEKDLRELGWQPGYSWCMLFVRLAVKKGSPTIWAKVKKDITPSVMTTYNNLIKAGYTVTQTPTPGAIAFWQNGSKWQGHTGVVDDNGITSTHFMCVEGNTDVQGSRDGGAVAIKKRALDFKKKAKGLNLLGFIEL